MTMKHKHSAYLSQCVLLVLLLTLSIWSSHRHRMSWWAMEMEKLKTPYMNLKRKIWQRKRWRRIYTIESTVQINREIFHCYFAESGLWLENKFNLFIWFSRTAVIVIVLFKHRIYCINVVCLLVFFFLTWINFNRLIKKMLPHIFAFGAYKAFTNSEGWIDLVVVDYPAWCKWQPNTSQAWITTTLTLTAAAAAADNVTFHHIHYAKRKALWMNIVFLFKKPL